jgi:hypothetical protein
MKAKRVYEDIACDMASTGRLEQAIQLLIRENCDVRNEVRDKLIETSQIARMFSLCAGKENYHRFVYDLAECAAHIENLQPGLWLDCIRDVAFLLSRTSDAWQEILNRITA